MTSPKTTAMRAVHRRRVGVLREQLRQLKKDLRSAELDVLCAGKRGAADDDPAWNTIATILTSTHPRAAGAWGMVEDFAKRLNRAGSLTERQQKVLVAIVSEMVDPPAVAALAFPCTRCGAAVGERCRGTRQPTIGTPHDERLDRLPQTRAVLFLRRDRILAVGCPRCGAVAGRQCEGPKGTRETPHDERIAAAPPVP